MAKGNRKNRKSKTIMETEMRMHRGKRRQTKRETRQGESHRKPGRKRDTHRARRGPTARDRWAHLPPAPTHAPGRGWVGASHLLDGAQRVCVLLLRLLDLSQAAAPLVIICHLGLRAGRRGRCWGTRDCPLAVHPSRPSPSPPHTGMGTGSERMRSS